MTEVFRYRGRYARDFTVFGTWDECMNCEQTQKCLEFDGSDGEYTAGVFCLQCLCGFFNRIADVTECCKGDFIQKMGCKICSKCNAVISYD